jgi:hypothetical protein
MKIGEFKKNVYSYSSNKLREIMRNGPAEFYQIALDELEKRGDRIERSKGGSVDKPLGSGGKK